MTMTSPLSQIPLSPMDESLLGHIDDHINSERTLLESYSELADEGPEHVRYLIGLILEDEARHHRLFREMAGTISGKARTMRGEARHGSEPSVPYLAPERDHRERLLEATARFLQAEREDARALKALERELRPMEKTSLHSLLVQLMELDTKKHITILEFIRETAKRKRPW